MKGKGFKFLTDSIVIENIVARLNAMIGRAIYKSSLSSRLLSSCLDLKHFSDCSVSSAEKKYKDQAFDASERHNLNFSPVRSYCLQSLPRQPKTLLKRLNRGPHLLSIDSFF